MSDTVLVGPPQKGVAVGSYIYQAVMTEDEEGTWCVEVPNLPGCFACGDTIEEAARDAAESMQAYVSSLLDHGEIPPSPTWSNIGEGARDVAVYFEAEPSMLVKGPCVSAAEAARMLGVSRARVTNMIASGILDAYREGRNTFVSIESIERRLAADVRPGRPAREAVLA